MQTGYEIFNSSTPANGDPVNVFADTGKKVVVLEISGGSAEATVDVRYPGSTEWLDVLDTGGGSGHATETQEVILDVDKIQLLRARLVASGGGTLRAVLSS